MKRRTLIRSAVLASLCSVALLSTAAHAAKWTLRFSHSGSEQDTQHLAALKFAELVRQRTNDEVRVDVFPNSALGNDQAMVVGVRSGTIDLGMAGTPYFTGIVGKMNVLDLPFLFENEEHAYKVLDGPVGQELLGDLGAHQMKGLAFFEVGFRSITNSRRPVRGPEDVKGLKLRTTPNPAHIKAFQLLGANPTPLSFAETFPALETGTVDGQENPVQIIWSGRLYEVQKYLSLTKHAYTAMPLVMNKAKFDALPPAHQKALQEAALEGARHHRDLNRKVTDANLLQLKQKGMTVEETVDTAGFRKAVAAPIRQQFVSKYGVELVSAVDRLR